MILILITGKTVAVVMTAQILLTDIIAEDVTIAEVLVIDAIIEDMTITLTLPIWSDIGGVTGYVQHGWIGDV